MCDYSLTRQWDVIAQEEVDGILLLSICVGIAVEPPAQPAARVLRWGSVKEKVVLLGWLVEWVS
jgi:hypothetical protein